MKHGISLCMMVKDEEEMLPACLEHVKDVVDEIIVVDTGSKDATIQVARSLGAIVVNHEWHDSFAEARNAGIDRAQWTWILILDADELLEKEDHKLLRELLEKDHSAYMLPVIEKSSDVRHPSVRLFRNAQEFRYRGDVHELVHFGDDPKSGAFFAHAPVRILHLGSERGLVGVKEKRYRNIRLLEKALAESADDYAAHFYLGREYQALQDYEEAVSHYEIAYKHSRDSWFESVCVRALAVVLSRLGRNERALEVLEQGVERYPDYTDLIYLRGAVHQQETEWEAALREFDKAIELGESPAKYASHSGVGTFRAWRGKASCYYYMGEDDKAIDAYKEALYQGVDDEDSFFWLGRLLLKALKPAAVEHELQSVASRSKRPLSKDQMTEIFARLFGPSNLSS